MKIRDFIALFHPETKISIGYEWYDFRPLYGSASFFLNDEANRDYLEGYELSERERNRPIIDLTLMVTVCKPFTNLYRHEYDLLKELQKRCSWYLSSGLGSKNPNILCTKNVEKEIEKMRELWNSFPADSKPPWITIEQINEYAKKMRGSI